VGEYWLVDLGRRQVEVWQRAVAEFVLVGTLGADEAFASAAFGLEVVMVGVVGI
jgi:hypothetical protein